MKSILFSLIILTVVCSCKNETANNDANAIHSETQVNEEADEVTSSSDGNYKGLYKADTVCKMTQEEIATLFAFTSSEMNELMNEVNPCSFMITYKDGDQGPFRVSVLKTTQTDNAYEINSLGKNESNKKYTQSIAGHTVYRHPNQGYFKIMHPGYHNQIKVQYRGHFGLTKEQMAILREKGLNAVRFLIAKYEE